MPQQNPTDYSSRGCKAIWALILALILIAFIPPQTILGVKLRRANILSDLVTFDDRTAASSSSASKPEAGAELFDAREFEVDMKAVTERIASAKTRTEARPTNERPELTYTWDISTPKTDPAPEVTLPKKSAPATDLKADARPSRHGEADKATASDDRHPFRDTAAHRPKTMPAERKAKHKGVKPLGHAMLSSGETPIEDYSPRQAMKAFYDTLLRANRPVRIAVLGDSFIEGDILTADLRERLQSVYGGGGTGFTPFSSPLTAYRRTVKTEAKGWNVHNIMQYKRTPAPLNENFYVSGWVCAPSQGASSRWTMTDFRPRLEECTTARLFFISPRTSHIEVEVNDSLRHVFEVEGDAAVRQIEIRADRIDRMAMKITDGEEGFVGYGAIFEKEGHGVVVDNYSVRSNNGQAMFRTNPSVNAQVDGFLQYDLVILQYGLNIMQQGVHAYTAYSEQIVKMVSYVRECFPHAAVLVLGVSERSVKGESGEFEPMDAIPHMMQSQRHAAQTAEAAFWPTSEAMQRMGGMEQFVQNGWAGKDYTHINYAGGQRIAYALFDALNSGARQVYEQRRIESRRRKYHKSVIDSLQKAKIRRELLPGSVSGHELTLTVTNRSRI